MAIRTMFKADLAKLFFPESISPLQSFRRALKNKGILERLKKETAYNCYDRSFSPKQIEIIYDELGLPSEADELGKSA